MSVHAEALRRVRSGAAATYESLTVVPLFAGDETGAAAASGYDLLPDAIAAGTARVTEVSESGAVPTLAVVNDGARALLLVDGEELVGARQNRIVNVSILVPARGTLRIPVSCVEAGRWGYRGQGARAGEFAPSKQTMHGGGRRRKYDRVTRSVRDGRGYDAEQGAVWEDVDRLAESAGVASPTRAMSEVFARLDETLDAFVARLGARPGQVGAVFVVRGEPVAVELFDDARTLAAYLPKLVRSWATETLMRRGEEPAASDAPDERVRRLLDEVCAAECSRHAAVGLGEDLRFADGRVTGGALAHEGAVVHLAAFRVPAGENEPRRRGRERERAPHGDVESDVPFDVPTPRDNRALLESLVRDGRARLEGVDRLLVRRPPPLPRARRWDRVEGCCSASRSGTRSATAPKG